MGIGSALPSDRGIRVEVVGIPEVQGLLVVERMNVEVVFIGEGVTKVHADRVIGKRRLRYRRDGLGSKSAKVSR